MAAEAASSSTNEAEQQRRAEVAAAFAFSQQVVKGGEQSHAAYCTGGGMPKHDSSSSSAAAATATATAAPKETTTEEKDTAQQPQQQQLQHQQRRSTQTQTFHDDNNTLLMPLPIEGMPPAPQPSPPPPLVAAVHKASAMPPLLQQQQRHQATTTPSNNDNNRNSKKNIQPFSNMAINTGVQVSPMLSAVLTQPAMLNAIPTLHMTHANIHSRTAAGRNLAAAPRTPMTPTTAMHAPQAERHATHNTATVSQTISNFTQQHSSHRHYTTDAAAAPAADLHQDPQHQQQPQKTSSARSHTNVICNHDARPSVTGGVPPPHTVLPPDDPTGETPTKRLSRALNPVKQQQDDTAAAGNSNSILTSVVVPLAIPATENEAERAAAAAASEVADKALNAAVNLNRLVRNYDEGLSHHHDSMDHNTSTNGSATVMSDETTDADRPQHLPLTDPIQRRTGQAEQPLAATAAAATEGRADAASQPRGAPWNHVGRDAATMMMTMFTPEAGNRVLLSPNNQHQQHQSFYTRQPDDVGQQGVLLAAQPQQLHQHLQRAVAVAAAGGSKFDITGEARNSAPQAQPEQLQGHATSSDMDQSDAQSKATGNDDKAATYQTDATHQLSMRRAHESQFSGDATVSEDEEYHDSDQRDTPRTHSQQRLTPNSDVARRDKPALAPFPYGIGGAGTAGAAAAGTTTKFMKKPRSDEIKFEDLTFGELIGEGNFGKVYRGSLWGQDVALKKLRFKSSSTDDKLVKEFKKEVRVMRALRHPNIVEFLGMCVKPGNLIIVTEFLKGGSLEVLMEKMEKVGKQLSTTRVLSLAKDVARGLNWLHHKGIIHRDLKTANILLDANGKGKLADFGLSHVRRTKGADGLVGGGNYGVVGTPVYMAPEVLRKDVYGTKADVFSFGIVLCEMIMGRYPYDDEPESTKTFEDAIVRGFRPELPPCLPSMQQLLVSTWQDDPEQRPAMDKVLRMLENIEREYQAERKHSLQLLESLPEEVQQLYEEEQRRAAENLRQVQLTRAEMTRQKSELISGRRELRHARMELGKCKKKIVALERSVAAQKKKSETLKRLLATSHQQQHQQQLLFLQQQQLQQQLVKQNINLDSEVIRPVGLSAGKPSEGLSVAIQHSSHQVGASCSSQPIVNSRILARKGAKASRSTSTRGTNTASSVAAGTRASAAAAAAAVAAATAPTKRGGRGKTPPNGRTDGGSGIAAATSSSSSSRKRRATPPSSRAAVVGKKRAGGPPPGEKVSGGKARGISAAPALASTDSAVLTTKGGSGVEGNAGSTSSVLSAVRSRKRMKIAGSGAGGESGPHSSASGM